MQLPLTSRVSTHDHTIALLPSSRLLGEHGGGPDGRQRAAHEAPQTTARRAASSPTSIFPTSGGRVHADHR